MDREKQIIHASTINIAGNVLLSIAKSAVGLITGSVAIVLDGVNSLTDALGSIIAIIGTKLAGRSADHDHPFGFGRMEYITSVAIAALILAAGITSLIESVKSIATPTTPRYSFASLAIVVVAAFVKFFLGIYLSRLGKHIESDSLIGSGADAILDGGVSMATFVAGIIYILTGWRVEAWLAAGISLLIIRSGVEILRSTVSKLLGERVSPEVAEKVEREVRAVDAVRFASGLVLLDFGPNEVVGAIHVTVDNQMTIAEFDAVAREVQERVIKKCGVSLAGVTPYPDVSDEEAARKVRAAVGRIVWRNENIVEMRGLYINAETREVRFDAIAEFGTDDINLLRLQLVKECAQACPGWNFDVRTFFNVSD
ncbi:MAG: cation transporter [Atopobiaceae bacterium]|nr:cation transporter [Atopobiaceae bacterium]